MDPSKIFKTVGLVNLFLECRVFYLEVRVHKKKFEGLIRSNVRS